MDRPSSTSSSEPLPAAPRRGLAWLLALLLAAGAVLAMHLHWHAQGYRAAIVDSKGLWALQRERATRDTENVVVLLGASRIQAAIDMDHLQALAPGYRPLMLAVNGTYPLAVLRDLAHDEEFRGTVICDIEANAFLPQFLPLQQQYVDYFHLTWTPSWKFHRRALDHWQRATVLGDPRYSAVATLRHALQGTQPFRDYARMRADRSMDIDFEKADPAAVRRHFAETLAGNIELWREIRPTPDAWVEALQPVFEWAAMIEARGGRVLFYQSPLHGSHVALWDAVYPPEDYWQRFVARSPFPVLDGRAHPVLDAFDLPDESHLDYREKPAFTEAWLAAIRELDLMQQR
jgi:hypothetical protein